MTEDLDVLVRHWLRRADEAIREAEIMASTQHWNTCVNRLYYACFYAATALLLHHGLSSAKHSGVRSLFNQHFVRTAVVSRDLALIYNELFTSRQVADYRPLVDFDETQVGPWIPQVRQFVEQIERLLPPAGG